MVLQERVYTHIYIYTHTHRNRWTEGYKSNDTTVQRLFDYPISSSTPCRNRSPTRFLPLLYHLHTTFHNNVLCRLNSPTFKTDFSRTFCSIVWKWGGSIHRCQRFFLPRIDIFCVEYSKESDIRSPWLSRITGEAINKNRWLHLEFCIFIKQVINKWRYLYYVCYMWINKLHIIFSVATIIRVA